MLDVQIVNSLRKKWKYNMLTEHVFFLPSWPLVPLDLSCWLLGVHKSLWDSKGFQDEQTGSPTPNLDPKTPQNPPE